jgi:hypothetical protein
VGPKWKGETKIKKPRERDSYLELEEARRRPLLMQQYRELAVPANLWNYSCNALHQK